MNLKKHRLFRHHELNYGTQQNEEEEEEEDTVPLATGKKQSLRLRNPCLVLFAYSV